MNKNYKNYNSYSKNENVENKDPKIDIQITPIGKVVANKLYVRTGPSKDFDPVSYVELGSELLITGGYQDPFVDWYEVITASGQEGYVMKDFVEIPD